MQSVLSTRRRTLDRLCEFNEPASAVLQLHDFAGVIKSNVMFILKTNRFSRRNLIINQRQRDGVGGTGGMWRCVNKLYLGDCVDEPRAQQTPANHWNQILSNLKYSNGRRDICSSHRMLNNSTVASIEKKKFVPFLKNISKSTYVCVCVCVEKKKEKWYSLLPPRGSVGNQHGLK